MADNHDHHDHSNCDHGDGPKKKPVFGAFNPNQPKPNMGSLKLTETPPKHATEQTFDNAVKNFKNDVKWIFEKSHNQYAKPVAHGDHFHPAEPKVTRVDKVGLIAGATVSLGVAIHGLVNIKRGLAGWTDKELDEKHAPSVQYTVVGAAETIGGAALAKRLLTGTWRVF